MNVLKLAGVIGPSSLSINTVSGPAGASVGASVGAAVAGGSVGPGVSAGAQAVRIRLISITALSRWNSFVFIESLLRENKFYAIAGNNCNWLSVLASFGNNQAEYFHS